MNRAAVMFLVLAVATLAFAGSGGLRPVRTANFNANPTNFPRSPEWVRKEAGYYFVSLGNEPVSLLEILKDARTTGTSTIVLSNWQARPADGFSPIDLTGAGWNTTPGIKLRRPGKRASEFTRNTERTKATLSFSASARAGAYLQIDVPSTSTIDLRDRPLLMIEVRSSHPGRLMRLRMLDLEGNTIVVPMDVPKAGKWVKLGPFTPGLDAPERGIRFIRALRLEKATPAGEGPEKVTVDVAAVFATSVAEELSEPFHPRTELGDSKAFAAALRECRAVGGRVVLELDAGHLDADSSLITRGRLRQWAARGDDHRTIISRTGMGLRRFKLHPHSDWSDTLAWAIGECVLKRYGVDGVYLSGLDTGPGSAGSRRKHKKALAAMLTRLRRAVKKIDSDAVLLSEHATDVTLKHADVARGPRVQRLCEFFYASSGTLTDVPVRSISTVDELHRVVALGLKTGNSPADLARGVNVKPGGGIPEQTTVALTTPEADAETFGAYKGKLLAARRRCGRFFDYWRGARWRGRILTYDDACEIYQFSSGREHLFNIVNLGDKPVGPVTLDVSHTHALSFTDAISGQVYPVRDGQVTLTVQPHGLVMLHTTFAAATRERYLTLGDE